MTCRIEECANESGLSGSARGLCRAHYRRWQRYGAETAEPSRVQSYGGDVCAEADCSNRAASNGLCGNHYAKARRKQDPAGQRARNAAFKVRRLAALEQQMGRPRPTACELCGETGYGRGNKPNAGICFDHDHETGKPRGWLCDRCNKTLGLVRDNSALLLSMARYVTSAKATDAGAKNDLPAQVAAGVYAPSKNDCAIADLVDRQDRVVIVSSRRPLAGYMPERQVIAHVH